MNTDYVSLTQQTDADFIQMARNVYAHLSDEISKKIFEAKSLFALTGNVGVMTGLDARYRNLGSDIECYARNIQKGDHVLIYGAGVAAHYLAGRFKCFGVIIDAFVEQVEMTGTRGEMTGTRSEMTGTRGEMTGTRSEMTGTRSELTGTRTNECRYDEKTGIRIISEQELIDNRALYADKKVIISFSVKAVADAVKKKLCEEVGIAEENISVGVYDWRNNCSQYFDYFQPGDNEVFVDCGCFDGGSCFRFAGWCGHKGYEHIYSFEADPVNYEKCKSTLEPLGKCDLYPYGTARVNEKVYFAAKGFEDSCIISREEAEARNMEGVEQIETIALDEVLKGKRITFLKMDVEGAEYDALLGAETLIKECRPRMAISIYHKPEDFVTIPDLVLRMHPDYRITFRHYGLDELETIMYVE